MRAIPDEAVEVLDAVRAALAANPRAVEVRLHPSDYGALASCGPLRLAGFMVCGLLAIPDRTVAIGTVALT